MNELIVKESHVLIETKQGVTDRLRVVGAETCNTILELERIKLELKANNLQDSKKIFWAIKIFIASLITRDPNQVHYDIVRSIVKKLDENVSEDSSIIDQLTRKLIFYCELLKVKLEKIADNLEDNDMFSWDIAFLEVLSAIGKEGKEAAKLIQKQCKNRLQSFKDNNKSPLSFWLNMSSSSAEALHISPALQILISVTWNEEIKKRINFGKKNPAGLTTSVQPQITKMLSFNTKQIQNQNEVQVFHDNHLLGTVPIIAIDPRVISYILKGVSEFTSLTAVRLILLLVRETYENLKNGVIDYNVLKFPGRAKEIAKKLGRLSNQEITRITNLIHAWDHFKFAGPEITSRLISLAECAPKSRYSYQGGWEITVLSPLKPYRIHNEKEGFIIPLLKEPPLIGHRSYHARQIILQWKITSEFSKQSTKLSKFGFIEITDEQWKEHMIASGLPIIMLERIKATWIGEQGFLEHKKDTHIYTLKECEYEKELKFLSDQGSRRITASSRGTVSAKIKAKTN